MLSEQDTIKMLRDWALLFDLYVKNKDYGKANYIYLKAQIIVTELCMGDEVKKELFGDWDSGDDETGAENRGLFHLDYVRKVGWECCIKRHQTYQDIACRKVGAPVAFYSDKDYCAMCEGRKKG